MKPAAVLRIWGPAPGFEAATQLEKESWFPNSACTVEADDARRPNFVAAIHGAPFGSMPPAFFAYSSDDVLVKDRVQTFYGALLKAGHHTELHVYRNGGHGYGLNPQGMSSDHWIEDYYNWVRSLGFARANR